MKTGTLLLLLLTASPARAQSYDDLDRKLKTLHGEAVALIKGKDPNALKGLSAKFDAMKKTVNEMLAAAKKLKDKSKQTYCTTYLEKLTRHADNQGKPFVSYVAALESLDRDVKAFETKHLPEEAAVLAAFDDVLEDGRKKIPSVAEGKESAVPYLTRMRRFVETDFPALEKRLGAVCAGATETFGAGSRRLKDLARLHGQATTLSEGTPEIKALAEAVKSAATEADQGADTYLQGVRKKHRDLLAGANGHRGFLARQKTFADQQKTLRDHLQGPSGFRWERSKVEAEIKSIAEGAKRNKKLDDAALREVAGMLDEVASACRVLRLKTPPWVREVLSDLQLLVGPAASFRKAHEGTTSAATRVNELLKKADQEYGAVKKAIQDSSDFAELLATARKVNALERFFEQERKSLDESLRGVETLLKSLEALRKPQGLWGEVMDVLMEETARVAAALKEAREKLIHSSTLRYLMEGLDGDAGGLLSEDDIENRFTKRVKDIGEAFIDVHIREFDEILSAYRYDRKQLPALDGFLKKVELGKLAFYDKILSDPGVDKYVLQTELKPFWTRYQHLTADADRVRDDKKGLAAIWLQFGLSMEKGFKAEVAFRALLKSLVEEARKLGSGLTRERVLEFAEKIDEALEALVAAANESNEIAAKAGALSFNLKESREFLQRMSRALDMDVNLFVQIVERHGNWGKADPGSEIYDRLKDQETQKLLALNLCRRWLKKNAWDAKDNPLSHAKDAWTAAQDLVSTLVSGAVIIGAPAKDVSPDEAVEDLHSSYIAVYEDVMKEQDKRRQHLQKSLEEWRLKRLKEHEELVAALKEIKDEKLKAQVDELLEQGAKWKATADQEAKTFFAQTWPDNWTERLQKKVEILRELYAATLKMGGDISGLWSQLDKGDRATSTVEDAGEIAGDNELLRESGAADDLKVAQRVIAVVRREWDVWMANRAIKKDGLDFKLDFYAAERFFNAVTALIKSIPDLDPGISLVVRFSGPIHRAIRTVTDFARDPRGNLRRHKIVLTDFDAYMREFVTNGYLDYLDAKTFRTESLERVDRSGLNIDPLDTGAEWTKEAVEALKETKQKALGRIPSKDEIGSGNHGRIQRRLERFFDVMIKYVERCGDIAAERLRAMSDSIERLTIEDLEEALRD